MPKKENNFIQCSGVVTRICEKEYNKISINHCPINIIHKPKELIKVKKLQITFVNSYQKIIEIIDLQYTSHIYINNINTNNANPIQIDKYFNLEKYGRMRSMGFNSFTFKDINILRKFDNLTKLTIISYPDVGTGTMDLRVLGNLKHLRYLKLSGYNSEDLEHLRQIRTLIISDYKNYDFIPQINKLTNIENLSIYGEDDYFDLKDISDMYNLKKLALIGFDSIVKINHLNKFRRLNSITIDCYLSEKDIIDLKNCKNLIYLLFDSDFSWNALKHFSKIKNIKQLVVKQICESDIKYIPKFKKLTRLSLRRSLNLPDTSFLLNLSNLIELDISGCNIDNVSCLSSLTKLTTLDISQNKLKDISTLSNLKQLRALYLNFNQIQDISPLKCLKRLTILCLSGNNIKNIKALNSLKNLKEIEICNNNIKRIILKNKRLEKCSFDINTETRKIIFRKNIIYSFLLRKNNLIKSYDGIIYANIIPTYMLCSTDKIKESIRIISASNRFLGIYFKHFYEYAYLDAYKNR